MTQDTLTQVSSRQRRRILGDFLAVTLLAIGLSTSVVAVKAATAPVTTVIQYDVAANS